ncbi:MAG: GIN domain-containing protein [Flavobacteriales bacterium]
MNAIRALLLIIALASCNKESAPDCFKRAGSEATEVREPGTFNRIELRDYIHYELAEDSLYRIEITAPENLIGKITTTIEDGQLLVRNENTCNFVRSFKQRIVVRIYAPSFPDVQNYSTGDLRTTGTIRSAYFKLENRQAAGRIFVRLDNDSASIFTHTGVCDVTLTGSTGTIHLFSQGVGLLDASALFSHSAYVNNSSIQDVQVRCSDYLFALVRLSGNVYAYGNPAQVSRQELSTGRLILVDE